MKIYIFPNRSYKLIQDGPVSNCIVNEELYNKIQNKKSEIDIVRKEWDSAKKISNDYEYIYTSSNNRKNISNILPVSRSFFKLREIIYDFNLDIRGKNSCIAEAPRGKSQGSIRIYPSCIRPEQVRMS